MSIPTRGEVYSQLTEHLRLAQEASATLAHLYRDDPKQGHYMARAWLIVSELMKHTIHQVTLLATKGRLN